MVGQQVCNPFNSRFLSTLQACVLPFTRIVAR